MIDKRRQPEFIQLAENFDGDNFAAISEQLHCL
jgi:hypothetical protein